MRPVLAPLDAAAALAVPPARAHATRTQRTGEQRRATPLAGGAAAPYAARASTLSAAAAAAGGSAAAFGPVAPALLCGVATQRRQARGTAGASAGGGPRDKPWFYGLALQSSML
jgi:hypothetical protein